MMDIRPVLLVHMAYRIDLLFHDILAARVSYQERGNSLFG